MSKKSQRNASEKSRSKRLRSNAEGMNQHHRPGVGQLISCRGGHFYDPAVEFGKVVQERIDREMRSSKCRSIPVGDRKPPPLTEEEALRFHAVMLLRKHWKIVSRVNFLRDCNRISKRFLLTVEQSKAVLRTFERILKSEK